MENTNVFIQTNSYDGGFLQSHYWRAFQEAGAHQTFHIEGDGFWGNGIVQSLPVVGEYLYFPRGPVIDFSRANASKVSEAILDAAKKARAKWIRIEMPSDKSLEQLRAFFNEPVVKAPHDAQPREIFIVDLLPNEERLLASMKPKTRYNVRLAEKKGVKILHTREEKYKQAFLALIEQTADRKEIIPHPKGYYEKFFSSLPENTCHLFVAEYQGEILATSLLATFGNTATYLHGGSSSKHRDVMAPYLLQWEQMKFAKQVGCARYDFGGVRVNTQGNGSWEGITRFKMGFSEKTEPILLPGTYDIILNPQSYYLYERLRLLKENLLYMKKFISLRKKAA